MSITNLKSFLKNHFYPLTLLGIVILICLANYTPGTWLSGWDNLHPEFNFAANITRSIFSVWEEYQGLGLLAGMAHASDLPRELLLFVLSFVIPSQFLRYFYHFSMIALGTLGMYWLLKYKILSHTGNSKQGAFLGSLFYLLNLGTIQYFYIPFEPYTTFWGFLPWELYVLLLYLAKPSKRNLVFFIAVNIFAIPQAYVQTIFLVYMICVLSILSWHVIALKTRQSVLESLKILLVICALNAFWLLPNLYFTISDVKTTQNSIHNKMDTEKFFQFNKKRGTITDFIFLKESGLDPLETDKNTQQTTYMLKSWRDHFSSPIVSIIGCGFFFLILIGIFRKNPHRKLIFTLFLISAIAFLSDTLPFSLIDDLLRSIPLLNQIFRNPFSKFIAPASLIFALGFSLGASFFLSYISDYKDRFARFCFLILIGLLLWYGFPAFKGQFIGPQLRVEIPHEYFQVFSYFKTQDKNARIMDLPQGSYWGWGSYSWGLTGSGFLWYGIEQPIMDRAFDVWSTPLEGYYWELWYSLKKRDIGLFNQVLEKYQIGFILYDPTYTPSDSNPFKTLYKQQDFFLQNNPRIELVKKFDHILIYKTKLTHELTNNILLKQNLPAVQNESFSNQDKAFQTVLYYTAKTSDDYIFPFGSLFTNRFEKEHQFQTKDYQDHITFSRTIPKGIYTLSFPSYQKAGPYLPVRIFAKKEGSNTVIHFSSFLPTIKVNGKEIPADSLVDEISIPGRDLESSIISINNQDFFTLNSLGSNFSLIGTTYFINSELANAIHIYSTKNAKIIPLPVQNFLSGADCSSAHKKTVVSSNTRTGLLTLQAKNTSTCAVFADAIDEIPKQSLVNISFAYVSSSDELPKFCLSDSDFSCFNRHQSFDFGFSTKFQRFSQYMEAEQGITDPRFQLLLDANSEEDRNKLKEIKYDTVSITVYPLISSINLFSGQNHQIVSDKTIEVNAQKDTVISIDVPKQDNSFTMSHLIGKKIYKKDVTTATDIPGKEFHLQELPGNALRVYAQDAYSQFWLRLPDVISNYGYIAELNTRNLVGYPFILNISTPQEANKYVYTIFEKTPSFSKNYFVLPPLYEFDKGMQILLMSSSFNNSPSVNDIQDVSLYPLPYDYITTIYLTSRNAPEILPYEFDKPVQVKKHNLASYEVTLGSHQNGTLVLSQSYHPGWKAYEIQDSRFSPRGEAGKIQEWFPFLFGKELKDHVMVNNWENGWVLPDDKLPGSTMNVLIVYLPQYLEYFGFLLLVLVIPVILLIPKRNDLTHL